MVFTSREAPFTASVGGTLTPHCRSTNGRSSVHDVATYGLFAIECTLFESRDRLGLKDAKLWSPMTTMTLKPCDGAAIILVELLKWAPWTKAA